MHEREASKAGCRHSLRLDVKERNVEFELDSDNQAFTESFRSFCAAEIGPLNEMVEDKREIPREQFKKLADVGYLGLLHETRYGGQGASYLTATLAQAILSEYCGSTFFSTGASAGLFGGPIGTHGSDAQKQKYLPAIIGGELIGALGVTEPDAGTDVNGLRTTATAHGDDIILNGQKTYITNAPVCDHALILARYTDKDGKHHGLTHFIVDMNTEGVSRGKNMRKLGLKGSPTGEIFMQDVKVKAGDILGRPGLGFRLTMETFNKERLSLGAYSVGVMAACLDESRSYSRSRKSFGRPIYKHQSVGFMLADMLTKYDAARMLLLETAWLMDRFAPPQYVQPPARRRGQKRMHNGHEVDLTAKCATVKLLASTYAREVTNLAVQLHGGAGYMEEYKVSRLYRDVKLAEIGGGTSEIQKQIIARFESKRVKA